MSGLEDELTEAGFLIDGWTVVSGTFWVVVAGVVLSVVSGLDSA
jgi:hypothetical protein